MSEDQEDAKATGSNNPQIRRGRVDSLTLYEITDNELDLLEKGSPNSTYFNFSIFFWSVGASFLVSLFTAEVSDRVFMAFVIIATVGISLGAILLIVWFRIGSEVSGVCRKIRERIAD